MKTFMAAAARVSGLMGLTYTAYARRPRASSPNCELIHEDVQLWAGVDALR